MRKLKCAFIVFLLLFFVSINLHAQQPLNGTIKGRIITTDNKPVQFANATLKNTGKTATTNAGGYFEITKLGAVQDTLVIYAVGIQTHKVYITLAAGEVLDAGTITVEYKTEVLQDVEITGRILHSYKSDYSFLVTKTQTPLKDVPQIVSTVTKELIQDKMELRLKDAITDVAGMNMYSGYNEYTIRGFRAENAHMINGLRAYNTSYTSPLLVNIERVEVIKGPAGVLFGNGDPGGTVNLVTKKPLAQNDYGINLYYGSWNTWRAQGDVTGPLNNNKTLLYRFNAGYEDAGSYRNQYFAKSYQLAPSISWIPNERVQLNGDFTLTGNRTIVDRGQPGILNDNTLKATPINLSVTQPGDYLHETSLSSIISFAYKINNNITFNSAVLNYLTWQRLGEHGLKNYITPDSINLYYSKRTFNTVTTTLSNYLAFNFNTGAIKHQLVAGYDYISSNVMLKNHEGSLDGFAEDVVGTFSLRHPVYISRPVGRYELETDDDGGDDAEAYSTQGAYVQEQLSYKKWQLLIGLRGEFYTVEGDDDEAEQCLLLPRVGIVYKATPNLSLYAAYNKGFDPVEASVNTQIFSEPLKPIYSELAEVGAKASFFKNKLFATLSVYSLTLKNVAVNANDPSRPDLFIQQGKDRARGFEAEVEGNLLPGLDVSLSYAHNIAKVVESKKVEDVGQAKENAPRNSSGSWVKYTFSNGAAKGFSIAAGHSQAGERNTLTKGLILPGYCIINAGLGYTYKRYHAALNVYNIGNTVYWVGGYNYASKWPGAPRSFMVNLAYNLGR